jgi:2-polyprenyl-3-methyl-5-hydroxy-6-metoxy-1,4-benzoquinol methylase
MKILVCPALKKTEGSGHLRRALSLLPGLGEDGRLLYDESESAGRDALLAALGFAPDSPQVQRRLDSADSYDLIVLDRRATAPEDVARLYDRGCLVGLDEGGSGRACLPFLIDTLPGTPVKHEPNVRTLQLPAYPEGRRKSEDLSFRNILVSFGGEDAAHLSERMVETLLSGADYGIHRITVVEGHLFGPRTWPEGVKVLRSPPRLVELIPGYDLVFCLFGLTCFEALSAGVPVILLNPTVRHRRLSRRLKLPEIGVKSPRTGKLRRLLARPELFRNLLSRAAGMFAPRAETLDALIRSLVPPERTRCPLCGAGPSPALARFPRRTYVRCRGCGLVYLLSFARKRNDYDGEYFFSEYRRQYGRTYLEDFETIKIRSAGRLAQIDRRLGPESAGSRRLLDVGCAYGAFLQAAREAGYQTVGLDLGKESSRYVRETLGLECLHGDFEKTSLPETERFDAVTMWFVIEHFQHTAEVLEKTAGLLKPGGIFAFSTPNGAGISARTNREQFLRGCPEDHYSLWFPARVRKQLKRFGFDVLAVRVTGHHPERFPLPAALKASTGFLLGAISRIFGLGDTFEVYAVKQATVRSTHAGR